MAYTFAVNTEKITELAGKLGDAKESISGESGIPGIFSTIDGLEGESWSGTSYTTFHDGAHRYEAALNTLPSVIGAFQDELTKLEGPAADCVTKINGEITKMSAE